MRILIALSLLFGLSSKSFVHAEEANYDESKVPTYTLPDPLELSSGARVTNRAQWTDRRRPEILELFRKHVYGQSPARPKTLSFRTTATLPNELGGLATRKHVSIDFAVGDATDSLEVVIYLPNDADRAVPIFVGIHLFDKRAERPIPGVPLLLTEKTKPGSENSDKEADQVLAGLPGGKLLEAILRRGYAIATIDAADLAPDSAENYAQGVIGGYANSSDGTRAGDEWGAIGAWAWGLSRTLDYFETDPAVDHRRVAVIGHSRMGKTALWAGGQDERFAMVISNNSGCGGAALSRRRFGEKVERINRVFPHWFCENFRHYNDNESALPVDQHLLVALIAPRPVYVASAVEDGWADPRGEFLSCLHSEPVYRLYGKAGLGVEEMPGENRPVGKTIGYHVRSGRHNLTDYDWVRYLNFADRHFQHAPRSK